MRLLRLIAAGYAILSVFALAWALLLELADAASRTRRPR